MDEGGKLYEHQKVDCIIDDYGIYPWRRGPELFGTGTGDNTGNTGDKGTVSRIDGNKLTILDDMNKEKTVKVKDKDLESLKAIKVGDWVLVRDGTVTCLLYTSPSPRD